MRRDRAGGAEGTREGLRSLRRCRQHAGCLRNPEGLVFRVRRTTPTRRSRAQGERNPSVTDRSTYYGVRYKFAVFKIYKVRAAGGRANLQLRGRRPSKFTAPERLLTQIYQLRKLR